MAVIKLQQMFINHYKFLGKLCMIVNAERQIISLFVP